MSRKRKSRGLTAFLAGSAVGLASGAGLFLATAEVARKMQPPIHAPFQALAFANARGSRPRPTAYMRGSVLVFVTPEGTLAKFEESRRTLVRSALTLTLPAGLPPLPHTTWTIPLAEHADWIAKRQSDVQTWATLDPKKMRAFLETEVAPVLPPPTNAHITALPSAGNMHAPAEGFAREGWVLHTDDAVHAIIAGVEAGVTTLMLPVERVPGRIVNDTSADLGALTLLARGTSDFTGSVPNRAFNVRKALREYVTRTLIPPGGTFSFTRMLGPIIDSRTGWKIAMGIFNGDAIEPTPGGGICQTSTTLYRALLKAGIRIIEQHNHSLYITFYAKHGEGLDATIAPGHKDLRFTNDTPGPLFIQAYEDGGKAIVELYGTPDGRSVSLEGPYRWNDAPENILSMKGGIGLRDIAWQQRITRPDGSVEEHILVSHYGSSIPPRPPE